MKKDIKSIIKILINIIFVVATIFLIFTINKDIDSDAYFIFVITYIIFIFINFIYQIFSSIKIFKKIRMKEFIKLIFKMALHFIFLWLITSLVTYILKGEVDFLDRAYTSIPFAIGGTIGMFIYNKKHEENQNYYM